MPPLPSLLARLHACNLFGGLIEKGFIWFRIEVYFTLEGVLFRSVVSPPRTIEEWGELYRLKLRRSSYS